MKRLRWPLGLCAFTATMLVAGAVQAQGKLDELKSFDFRIAISKEIQSQGKDPTSKFFKEAVAVFDLSIDKPHLERIIYNVKTHTLVWRCPPRPGVSKPKAEAALPSLDAFAFTTLVAASVIKGDDRDSKRFFLEVY